MTDPIYLPISDLLVFGKLNTDKNEFNSVWIWIMCNNDAMDDADSVTKCDIYPQNIHFVLKFSKGYHFMS